MPRRKVMAPRRREWLDNYEAGMTPKAIASRYGYDVRTVKKHLELAQEERNRKEARAAVFRNALERHYQDLCAVAEQLRASLVLPSSAGTRVLREDVRDSKLLKQGLRSHLPKWSLWPMLERWDRLFEAYTKATQRLRARVVREAEARPQWKETEGFVLSICHHLDRLSQGGRGLPDVPLSEEPAGTAVSVGRGNAYSSLALVPPDEVGDFKQAYDSLLRAGGEWPEVREMAALFDHLRRLQDDLYDELDSIIFKRIVPGQCRYCPI